MSHQTEVSAQIGELLSQASGESLGSTDGGYNFVTSGVLDSFSLLIFITDVEEQFQIAFSADELTNESMQTIAGLSELVVEKLD